MSHPHGALLGTGGGRNARLSRKGSDVGYWQLWPHIGAMQGKSAQPTPSHVYIKQLFRWKPHVARPWHPHGALGGTPKSAYYVLYFGFPLAPRGSLWHTTGRTNPPPLFVYTHRTFCFARTSHIHPPVPHRARGSPISIVKTPTYLPPSKSVNGKNWRTPVLSMKSACTTLHRLQGARCGDTAPPRSRGPSHSPFPGVLTRCQAPLGRESLPPRAKNRCHTLPLSVCTDST